MTAAMEPREGEPPMEGQPNGEPCSKADRCTACRVDTTFDGRPRCTAGSSQSGHRCGRAQTPGTTVCASHGSKAPQVRTRIQLRLVELIDPAIATLAREMTTAKSSADRQRAANSLLDRAGVPRRTEVDHGAAQALLLERIQEVLARRPTAEVEPADPEQETVDAEIIDDERMEA